MRRVLLDRRGITPVLSNVLLMAIAVAGMSIAIAATYVITGNLRETMGERFVIEDVWFKTDGEISVYLRNTGKMSIKVAALYVNYTAQSFTSLELDVGGHGWLSITYNWSSNSVYYIKVATSRGTQVADYYRSPA